MACNHAVIGKVFFFFGLTDREVFDFRVVRRVDLRGIRTTPQL